MFHVWFGVISSACLWVFRELYCQVGEPHHVLCGQCVCCSCGAVTALRPPLHLRTLSCLKFWMTLKILWLYPLIDADLQVSISPRRQEQQFWFVSWQPVNTCRSDGDKMLFGLDWSHDLQTDLFEKYFSNMLRCFLWPRSTTCWLYFFSYCVKTDDCSLCAAGSLHLCFWLKYLNIHWMVSY